MRPQTKTTADNMASWLLMIVLAFLFFLSGFAALLYQVIWQRLLGLFSGADVYSVTIIVSAFMLGMGLGSIVGGYFADKLNRNRLIMLFACAELVISLFALISKWFYYDILYQSFPELSGSYFWLSIILFFSLLIPTFFMGITLPLLSKALVIQLDKAPLAIGVLYALNTLGASIGSLVTAVILIRNFGFEVSIKFGACLNFMAMAGAMMLLAWNRFSGRSLPEIKIAVNSNDTPIQPRHFSFNAWILIYMLSGFIALGLEIIWFRIMGVMLKSTAFTFGTLLFIYLSGLSTGTLTGLFFSRNSRHPQIVFFILQAAITLYAVISLILLVYAVDRMELLSVVWNYFASPINFEFAFDLKKASPEFVAMYFFVTPALIFPPTFFMGASFPYLQKTVQSDLGSLGRRVGWLQTANIFGSTLGACLIGLFLLDVLGTTKTLAVMVVLGGIYLLFLSHAVFQGFKRKLACFVSVVWIAAVVFFIPDPETFWSKLYGTPPHWKLLYAEDSSGLAAIKTGKDADFTGPEIPRGQAFLYINGATESDFPFGGQHSALGLIPVMIHPAPRDIMIIGLGSGDTLFSAGGRVETENLVCVEILASQYPNLRALHQFKPYAALRRLFENQRIQLVFTDARTWLMRSGRKFDVIEADPLRPNMAYAGNLYSKEYFTLVKDHLKQGGYAVSWMPSGRTIQTFRAVFPYTLNIGYWMFIGSNEPVKVDRDIIMQRIHSPEIQAYYKDTGINVAAIVDAELNKIVNEPQERWESAGLDVNTDLFPKDEYEKP